MIIRKLADLFGIQKRPQRVGIVERFWKKVQIRSKNECWPWVGTTENKFGYGVFGVGKSSQFRAHRISFLIEHGTIDPFLDVLHSCDNPLCMNPRHLRQGTQKQNNEDMIARNRYAKGESANKSDLVESDVVRIRKLYGSRKFIYAELGEQFGISGVSIHNIVTRKHWNHV